jgi:hypothetical protein
LTWVLHGGDDLDSKIGQKVQVTGRAGAVPDTSTPPTTTGAATGTTATGTTGATSTTGTSTGTAGATGTSGTASDAARNKVAAAQLKLDVKSVKTIASSCS